MATVSGRKSGKLAGVDIGLAFSARRQQVVAAGGEFPRQAGEEVDGVGRENGLVFGSDLAADVDGGVVLVGHVMPSR